MADRLLGILRHQAGLDTPPKLPLCSDDEVLIERISVVLISTHLPPPVMIESTAVVLLCRCLFRERPYLEEEASELENEALKQPDVRFHSEFCMKPRDDLAAMQDAAKALLQKYKDVLGEDTLPSLLFDP